MSERRTAVVTGGSSGIGLAISKKMIENGVKVVIIGRNEAKLTAAADRLNKNVHWIKADVGRTTDVESAVKEILEKTPAIDYLINNAGFSEGATTKTPLYEAEKAWNNTIDANLKGAFLMSVALGRYLRRPGGRIITISSIAAYTGGSNAGALAYAAAKSGVHGLTYALARELSEEGITINAIAPGLIDETNFFNGKLSDEKRKLVASETPAGRPGKPEDIAEAVWYMVSEEASFVTGEILNVNGGWLFGR